MDKKYIVKKKYDDIKFLPEVKIWEDVNNITIGKKDYLWINNGYKPNVNIKVFHTDKFICLKFKVFEKKVTIKHTKFGSDVWKDSCVEFFINPFPEHSKKYFNIEINALGIPLIGVGESGNDSKRYYFNEKEIKDWEIISSINEPIVGEHGNDFWTLHYKIPKIFFEDYYERDFTNIKGNANFYKCGDETEYEHYGAWNKVVSEKPNFHLPEYFGEIYFTEKSEFRNNE